ncbi:MAG TPA: hypothetical protein ENF37_00650 [Beggiatoa sp.]|nr:hypothetical protein [Beggiatoa sp.]
MNEMVFIQLSVPRKSFCAQKLGQRNQLKCNSRNLPLGAFLKKGSLINLRLGDWSAKFILRLGDWSAKFILRLGDWSAKFILRFGDWSAKFILRRRD